MSLMAFDPQPSTRHRQPQAIPASGSWRPPHMRCVSICPPARRLEGALEYDVPRLAGLRAREHVRRLAAADGGVAVRAHEARAGHLAAEARARQLERVGLAEAVAHPARRLADEQGQPEV